jgi:hypothetical protein
MKNGSDSSIFFYYNTGNVEFGKVVNVNTKKKEKEEHTTRLGLCVCKLLKRL